MLLSKNGGKSYVILLSNGEFLSDYFGNTIFFEHLKDAERCVRREKLSNFSFLKKHHSHLNKRFRGVDETVFRRELPLGVVIGKDDYMDYF